MNKKTFAQYVEDLSVSLEKDKYYMTRKETSIRGPFIFKILDMKPFVKGQYRHIHSIEVICSQGFMFGTIYDKLMKDGISSHLVSHELALAEVMHFKMLWGQLKILKEK